MKALYDTNVLLDVLLEREPFWPASVQVWTLAELGRVEALAAAISFTNVFYIVRRLRGQELARDAIRKMRNVFVPAACDAWVINAAADADLPDFEDAVQLFSALRAQADCILTRDLAGYPRQASVPVLSPAEFLAQLGMG